MICPNCGGISKVIDSREVNDYCRRRRECLDCHARFSTKEVIYDYQKGYGAVSDAVTKKERLMNSLIVEYLKELSADEIDRLYEKI